MHWLVLAVALIGAKPSDVWPGFRGSGDNRTAARNLPRVWSPTKNIAWVARLSGYGQSSPVIWEGRLFLTSIQGPNKEQCLVTCYDVKSGDQLWQQKFTASQTKKFGYMVSKAAPTPAVDKDGVYAFFESGELVGLTHDGKVKWQRSLTKEYGEFKNGHGLGSSIAQTGDSVIVLVDHGGPSYLLAVDKTSGKNRWKTEREKRVSWTSPVVAYRNGKPEIVVSSNGLVQGYDADNGKALWKLDGISGNTIPSASVSADLVLIGAALGRRNPDTGAAARSNCCLKLVLHNGKPGYEVLWTAKKAISYYATPLAHRGLAYFVNKVGVVYCLNLKDGKRQYARRLGGPCWTSPLGAGDYVYLFGKNGLTTVIKTGAKFEKVASNRLWTAGDDSSPRSSSSVPPRRNGKTAKGGPRRETRSRSGSSMMSRGPVVYGVAAIDGALFIRTGTKLYCIRNGVTKSKK